MPVCPVSVVQSAAGRTHAYLREKGRFKRLDAEIVEPDRTRRLLARPCTLVHSKASDMLDAYGFSLLARSGGSRAAVAWFEVNIMFGQLLVALLNGLGTGLNLEAGSLGASAQVLSIVAVQAYVSLWVFQMGPSADRLQTTLVGTQFALEAGQSSPMLAYTFLLHRELERASFVLAVSSLAAPIVLLLYDACIVTLYKFVHRGSFKRMELARDSCATLVCFLPRFIMVMVGVEAAKEGAFAENAGEDLQKIKERQKMNRHENREQTKRNLATHRHWEQTRKLDRAVRSHQDLLSDIHVNISQRNCHQ